jgi:hypothetical protein
MSTLTPNLTVITRLVRVIQLGRPDKPGDDDFCFGISQT